MNKMQKPPAAVKAGRFSSLWNPKPKAPALTFSPLAWLKLRLFLHADDVEVGGFGLSSADDLLYVEDLLTVKQQVSMATVEFDDEAVADHFEDCCEAGIAPNRCGRLWIHTHPGNSAHPSSTDEETFARVFGSCDWAMMVIIARGGESYARLQFSAGPTGQVLIPVNVDWESYPELLSDLEGKMDQTISRWMDEYGKNVHPIDIWSPQEAMIEMSQSPVPAPRKSLFPEDEIRRGYSFEDLDRLDDPHTNPFTDEDFVRFYEEMYQ